MLATAGVPFHPYLITAIAVLICPYAASILYRSLFVWLIYPILLIPAVYYCTYLIKRIDGRRDIRKYKSICIFVALVNEFFSLPLISFKTVMVLSSSVGFTICLIDKVSFVSLTLLTLSGLMLLVANVSFSFAKRVFQTSDAFLQTLKSSSHPKFVRYKTCLSLRKCRIHCGSLYFVDQEVLMKINNAILVYTISNVIMFKGIW